MVKEQQLLEDNGQGFIPGAAVDARGNPVVDPTKNVLDLVRAESKYQDGMREASDKLVQFQIQTAKEALALQYKHTLEMNDAESRRVNEQLTIRANYDDELRQAEAKRIDAIRAVDVNAVSVASQRASDQASVLATQVAQSAEQLRTQVAQSAEALRALVATTAAAAATTLQQLVGPLSTRIGLLEQVQYEGKGKQGVVDPQIAEMLSEIRLMRGTKSEGISTSWGVFLGLGSFIVAIIAIVISTMILLNRPAPQVPQVQVLPAPANVLLAPPTSSP